MFNKTNIGLFLAAIILIPNVIFGQENAGPKVGTKIENFSLEDQSGSSREFNELLRNGPVAVVFHRSAEW